MTIRALPLLLIGSLPLVLPLDAHSQEPRPDFDPISLHAPAAAHIGEKFVVEWSIANWGADAGLPVKYALYLSDNPILTIDDSKLHEDSVVVDAASTVAGTDTVNAPRLPPGQYWIGIVVDNLVFDEINGDILEANEGNNLLIRAEPVALLAPVELLQAELSATVGVSGCARIEATGGDSLYTWTFDDVPPGMAWQADGASALLCGIPEESGTFGLHVRVESAGRMASATYTLLITPAPAVPPLRCSVASPAAGEVGTPFALELQAVDGTGPYAFATVEARRLAEGWFEGATFAQAPPGLALSEHGEISGTPEEAGRYLWTVEAIDSSSGQASCSVALEIVAPGALVLRPSSIPDVTVASAYSASLSAIGGVGPIEWSLAPSNPLPEGLEFGSDGTITGTVAPAELEGQSSRSYTFDVRAVDSQNRLAEATVAVRLLAPPATARPETPDSTGRDERSAPASGSDPGAGCSTSAGSASLLGVGLALLGLRRR